jgi:flagellar hook-length control protein FliK
MIDSSMGVGASAPPSPDPAVLGASGEAEAADGSSPFSMMLSGMIEIPATKSQLPATEDTDVPDAALLDPALAPADAAAQAIVAALVPAFVAPAFTPPPEQSLPAEGPTVSLVAARPVMPALDKDALTVAWLVASTRDTASDAGDDTPLDVLGEVESPTIPTLGAQGGAASAPGAPASGFNPMAQVSQLSTAFAQASSDLSQPQPPLQHNVGTARWAEELGSRLTMMASQGQLSGSLTLSPEHLGPLHVQIDIKNDVASVWFGSQHADTRAALHDALPRLREMFGASGLVLGDTGVSRDTPRQEAQAADARRFSTQREESVVVGSEIRAVHIAHMGILDTYA